LIDPLTSVESRRGLAVDRADALRRAARPASPGPLRRLTGVALIRIGHALGGAGDSPRPRPALPPMPDEAPACAGASSS
jgi:hypothetical protein